MTKDHEFLNNSSIAMAEKTAALNAATTSGNTGGTSRKTRLADNCIVPEIIDGWRNCRFRGRRDVSGDRSAVRQGRRRRTAKVAMIAGVSRCKRALVGRRVHRGGRIAVADD